MLTDRRRDSAGLEVVRVARLSATSGRSTSLGRGRVFEHEPARRNARWKLDRAVRRTLGTRRLYSQHNSVTLASGPSRTTARSTVTSIGHGQPPPLGCGARGCVSRQRATHRSSVRWSTSNSAASRAYDPSPRSYAVTARSRSARSYGLNMAPLKYSSFGHSNGIRDSYIETRYAPALTRRSAPDIRRTI